MKLRILTACLVILAAQVECRSPLAKSPDWLDGPRKEALRLATQWSIDEPTFVVTDSPTVETSAAGVVIVGRKLLDSLHPSQDLQDIVLTFILLHELWHVKQFSVLGSGAFQDQKERPVLECQADVEAGRLIVLDNLKTITDISAKDQITTATRAVDLFKSAWALLIERSPVESDFHMHLSKRQRILALQFSLWRAYSDFLQSVSHQTPQIMARGRRVASQADAETSVSLHDWSRSICERIVTYDADALSHLSLLPAPGGGLLDGHFDEFNLSVQNNSDRDIQFSATALSGHIPKGEEQNYEKFVFVDASSSNVIVKPRQKVILAFKVIFPLPPPGSNVFIWQLPWMDQMLLAARYASPPRPPWSCAEKWALSGRTVDPTLADIARLSSFAIDRFDGTWTRSNTPGMMFALPIEPAIIPVRGAIKTVIYVNGEPSASATLYEGPSKDEAIVAYNVAATSVHSACSELPATLREWISKDQLPTLRVERITAYSEAVLSVSVRTPEHETQAQAIYETSWNVRYNPP